MRIPRCLLLPALVLGVSACAVNPPPAPHHVALHPEPPEAESASHRPISPRAPLTLESAIEMALRDNPGLRAEYARYESMLLDSPQASALPDPMAEVSQQEAFRGPGNDRENMLNVSQTFPWFGKRGLRGKVARADAFEAFEEYRASALDVRREVSRAWHTLLYEQANRNLTIQDHDLLDQTLQATLSLYEVGRADRGSLLRAQTEMARIESELPEIEARIEALQRELQRLLGMEHGAAIAIEPGEADALPEIPPLETILAEAVSHRPELERYRHREEAARLAERLAKSDYYPDLTVGVGFAAMGDRGAEFYTPDSDDRTDSWRAQIGVNIPIPNARRRAATEQARHRIAEATLRQQATADVIVEEIHVTVQWLKALERQHVLFRDTILILAEEAYDAADTAYRVGRTNYVDLIDTQRTLIGTRRDMLRIERDHHLSVAELERAIGLPLHLVPHATEAQP